MILMIRKKSIFLVVILICLPLMHCTNYTRGENVNNSVLPPDEISPNYTTEVELDYNYYTYLYTSQEYGSTYKISWSFSSS